MLKLSHGACEGKMLSERRTTLAVSYLQLEDESSLSTAVTGGNTSTHWNDRLCVRDHSRQYRSGKRAKIV